MIIRFNYRQLLAMACVLVAVFATSAPAVAADCPKSVTGDQYGDQADQLDSTCIDPTSGSGGSGSGGSADPTSGSAGSLPFTGLDLGLMAAGAGVLLVGGVALRRRSRADTGV